MDATGKNHIKQTKPIAEWQYCMFFSHLCFLGCIYIYEIMYRKYDGKHVQRTAYTHIKSLKKLNNLESKEVPQGSVIMYLYYLLAPSSWKFH